jgi:kynurenine formamidase
MNKQSQVGFHQNGLVYYDLTHAAPMFEPLDKDMTLPDINKPVADSQAVCGHGLGTRQQKPNFQAAAGYFQWGLFCMDEHFATHVDSQCHFVTTDPKLTIDQPDKRYAHEFTLADLIGPLVYIDISERVDAELNKNGGKPSPDTTITDFSNSSQATVRLADIECLEEFISDGSYLVFNTGWERMWWGENPENGWYHPYNNGLNHPGVTPEVVDWLIALEERKGIRINGLIADNIAVESGESLLGPNGSVDEQPARINGPYLHALGLQRGWKLVENVANLDQLKDLPQGKGTLLVGASRIIGVSGAPARVMAMYPESSI